MIAEAPRVTEGTLRTAEGLALPLEHTEVRPRIVGPMAEVEVRQRFRNPLDRAIEAEYLFPLPHGASVHRMEFRIRDRVVQAVVKEKEEARRTYEAARSQGRAATLLEQDRPNLFTLSIANIPAGEAVEVTLGYQELLGYDDGEWRFVFPLVSTDRYSAEPAPKGPVPPPRPRTHGRPADVSLHLELDPGREIEAPRCLSHPAAVRKAGTGFTVDLEPDGGLPNRDFVLAWRAARPGVRPEVWFAREADRPGAFLLVLTPPATDTPKRERKGPGCLNCGAPLEDETAVKEVPGLGPAWKCGYCGAVVPTNLKPQQEKPPRDVVFVVDRSNSMRPANLEAAAEAVARIALGLSPDDAVRALAFDHDVQDSGTEWVAGGEAGAARMRAFVQALRPRGGTELEAALRMAGAIPARAGRARLVVLLSDAAVGNEGRLLRLVPELIGADARLYVLGLGPAPNRYLVERLARAGGGASDVLVPGEPVDTVLERFARRVHEAGPLLRDLTLQWEDAMPLDVFPAPIPDLHSGQPVHLVGRFTGSGPSRLVLTGTTAGGAPYRQEIDAALPDAAEGPPGLERMWARLRIDSLLERLERRPETAADVRLEVLGLALKHRLVSPYTSLVAEDSEVVGTPGQEPVKLEVPAEPVLEREGGAMYDLSGPGDDDVVYSLDFAPAEPSPASRTEAPRGRSAARPGPRTGELSAPPPPPPMRSPSPMPMRSSVAPPSPSSMAPPGLGAAAGGLLDAAKGMFRKKMRMESTVDLTPRFGTHQQQAPVDLGPALRDPKSAAYSEPELQWARSRTPGEIDLVFVVDETGSMGPYIEQVKTRLLELVEAVRASALCKSLRLGLVTFRDHPPQDHTFVTRVVPLTEDIAALRRGVNAMQANGGGDGPEALTDGLHDLLHLEWRPQAVRVAVLVGDAPPHGVEPHGDAFPEGCPCGRHWYVQAESCREMGISVHAVGCLPGLRGFVGAEEVFRSIARASRGLYLPLTEARLLVPLITGVADRELDRRRLEEHIAEILAKHQAALQGAEEAEKVRFVQQTLAAAGVRRLDLPADASPRLEFRDVTREDVEAGLDELRRLARTTV